jgi:alkanesulfonate monooxygenase SsuD/methylene tetrahydromethanopterin reductase-like flavin-dependent oxidoreductase (luciferase family)
MRYAIDLPNFGDYGDPRLLAGLARETEDHGWEIRAPGAMPVVDTTVTLAVIALETHRIHFGPMVIPLPRRSPWKVAREAVTLDHLSNGRLILGMGSGGDWFGELTTLGSSVDDVVRAEQLDEGLAILSALMRGEDAAHEGKHYKPKSTRFFLGFRSEYQYGSHEHGQDRDHFVAQRNTMASCPYRPIFRPI